MNFSTKLNQTAVYWAPAASDEYGNSTHETGEEITVRWEDRVDLFVNAQGEDEHSQAVVYGTDLVVVDGYLYLGTLASLTAQQQLDPTIVRGAYRVRQSKLSPSVGATQSLRKTWL